MRNQTKILFFFLMMTAFSFGNLSAQTDTLLLSRELLIAVYRNSIDSTLLLLKQGAKTNSKDEYGNTPIFYAVQNQNMDLIKLLEFNGANINMRNFEGTTPLSFAVFLDYFDIAEYLCYKGAMVNKSDKYGAIPLHYAAYFGDYYMADMLIFYKSDVNNSSFDKNQPLHLAALSGDTAMIQLLLKHGAKPESENTYGRTPIEMAIEHKQLYATILLLKSDSVSEFLHPNNFTLLNLALKSNADTIADSLICSSRFNPPQKNDVNNPYNIALALGKYKLKPNLKAYGYSSGLWPFFSKMSVMNTFIFNKDDHYFNFQVGALDVKYHLDFSLGFGSRFSRKPVLLSVDKNIFYQVYERRNLFIFGIKKRFYFSPDIRMVSIFAGIDFQSHFGNYAGSNQKLQQKFAVIPKAGISFTLEPFIIEAAYNYIDYGLYGLSSHFVSLGLGFNINFISSKTPYIPSWL